MTENIEVFTDCIDDNGNDQEKEGKESDDSKECKGSDDIDGNSPIYHGHHMNIYTSMVLIFTMCHNVSSAMLSDLLTIINLHCLYPHPGLKSIYAFKQYFANLQSPMKKHYYCPYCMCNVSLEQESCSNETCLQSFNKKTKSYFIEIPLEDQIRSIFEKGNILSSDYPYNISFTWNTDGIPIFKSSKRSIWPLYLTINELPIKQRMQTENMLLYGLWFGESKPFMSAFTKPLTKILKKIETVGIDFKIDDETKNSRGFLICGTADLPAKSLVMNCNQFNEEYCCLRCLHPGETFQTSKGGSVRVFPYDSSKPQYQERTKDEWVKNSLTAIQERKTVQGIKGPSFLMVLPYYDLVRSSSIDYMHGVLLGITKLLIDLWTGGSTSKEAFSISSSITIIDERLK